MMNEILQVVETVSNEKRLNKEAIFQAIEAALASTFKNRLGREKEDADVRVAVDRQTGDCTAFRRWEVVSERLPELPERQKFVEEARKITPEADIGQIIEESLPPLDAGRISAHHARQVILQKVREAERGRVIDIYKDRVGQMVSGVVKNLERGGGVALDLGDNAEAYIPRSEMIPRETFRPGERLRAYLREVREETRGPQLFLSRTCNELLLELFRLEVPEIAEGVVEIVAGVRDPGNRARIAVRARELRIDPIGACVGMRGSRVQAVSGELNGERVDIVQWDENPAQFVINALVPAEISSLIVDEDSRVMDVIVSEQNLSLAIGRSGQNVKLASELCGWTLNIMSEEDAEKKAEEESARLREQFQQKLKVDKEVASILVQEGFSSLEEIAYVPEQEILRIDEFDKTLVTELRERAQDWLLVQRLALETRMMNVEPPVGLFEIPGLDRECAWLLASHGVRKVNTLAELDIDELMDMDIGLAEEEAGTLIMKARDCCWFDDGDKAAAPTAVTADGQ